MNKKILIAGALITAIAGGLLLPSKTNRSITPDVIMNSSSTIPIAASAQTTTKPTVATEATTAPATTTQALTAATSAPEASPTTPPAPSPPTVTLINYNMIYQPADDGGQNSLCAFNYSDGTIKQVIIGHTTSANAKMIVDCADYIK